MRPTIASLATAALAAALLTGCDPAAQVTGPDPQEAADQLAGALASGTFDGVEFSQQTTQQVRHDFDRTVAGMGAVEPEVTVGDVSESGDSATATLDWSWPVGGRDWQYETTARMTQVDDAWQVAWDPAMVGPSLRDGATLSLTPIDPKRGDIVGAGGRALVKARPVVRFGIDKSQVSGSRAVESSKRLAAMLHIDAASYAKRVRDAGEKAYVEAIVYRADQVPERISDYEAIPGVLALGADLPLARTKEFAAPILGSVGEVTAEMVKKSPETYHPGDQAGLSGLQARYDDQLRGTPGAVVEAVGPGDRKRELFKVGATDGKPLRITLDEDLEATAERLLANVGPASALVAIRPSTGDILAAANGPGNNGYNMATYGRFAPGSTFKSVSSLALLRAGLTPDSTVPCTTSITVDGKRFENYDDYPSGALGRIPLRTALANSCNTAFISQAPKLGGHDLVDSAAALGFGVDHDLGFPAYFGSVTPPTTDTTAAADMIGQGQVLASPMAMATVIASIQSGKLVVPRLVTSVNVPAPDGVDPVSKQEATTLASMLRGVVTSGSGSVLADVPGPPVIAKTGTAEFEAEGKVLTHAWMIAAQGDLAVAAFVDRGDSGSGTAGPILEAFLRAARG